MLSVEDEWERELESEEDLDLDGVVDGWETDPNDASDDVDDDFDEILQKISDMEESQSREPTETSKDRWKCVKPFQKRHIFIAQPIRPATHPDF